MRNLNSSEIAIVSGGLSHTYFYGALMLATFGFIGFIGYTEQQFKKTLSVEDLKIYEKSQNEYYFAFMNPFPVYSNFESSNIEFPFSQFPFVDVF